MTKDKELALVTKMVDMYYKKHTDAPIDKQELLQYIQMRSARCPHGDNKPFCNVCPIHCYKPDMRQQIKLVMKYAGPRLMLTNPIQATRHLISTIRAKRRNK